MVHRQWKKTFLVFILTSVIVLVFMYLGAVIYETNDDETLNLIMAGAYGPSKRTLHQHILIGTLISGLFRVFPAVNWYLWLMLAVNFASVFSICLVISSGLDYFQTAITVILINLLLDKDFFNSLQYTKNAALYTAVGGLLLYYVLHRKNTRDTSDAGSVSRTGFIQYIPGIFFLCLGFMIRRDSFISVIPFVLVPAFIDLFRRDKVLFGRVRNLCIVCAVLISGLYVSNRLVYETDPEWKAYLEFNDLRTKILDYELPDYSKHKEEYNALDLYANDVKMFRSWVWADPDKFTPELLEEILKIQKADNNSSLRMNRTVLFQTCSQILTSFTGHVIPVIFIVLLFLVGFFLGPFETAAVSLMAIGNLAEYWYIVCLGRIRWRAELGIWLVPMILAAGMLAVGCRPFRLRSRRLLLAGTLLCCAVQTGSLFQTFFVEKKGFIRTWERSYRPFFEETSRRTDSIYLLDTVTFTYRPFAKNIYMLDGSWNDLFRNVGFLGGWIGTSPTGQYNLHRNGISNPMRALLERDDVYLADNTKNAYRILHYLERVYDPTVRIEKVEFIDDIQIFRFVRGE